MEFLGDFINRPELEFSEQSSKQFQGEFSDDLLLELQVKKTGGMGGWEKEPVQFLNEISLEYLGELMVKFMEELLVEFEFWTN